MAKLVDRTGQVYGRLTVTGRAPNRVGASGPKTMWWCRCTCGNLVEVNSAALVDGRQVSCGCWRQEQRRARRHNLVGKRFTLLTVVGPAPDTNGGRAAWLCRCDCGTELEVQASNLTTENTTSCGCLKRRPGATNPNWKGDSIGYDSMHARLGRWLGEASQHPCADGCGRQSTTWSYDHEDPYEHIQEIAVRRRHGAGYLWLPFSLDTSHYQARCWPCHNALDHPARALIPVDSCTGVP